MASNQRDHALCHILLLLSSLDTHERSLLPVERKRGEIILDLIRLQKATKVQIEFIAKRGIHLHNEGHRNINWHVVEAVKTATEATMARRSGTQISLDHRLTNWVNSRVKILPPREITISQEVFESVTKKSYSDNTSLLKVRSQIPTSNLILH